MHACSSGPQAGALLLAARLGEALLLTLLMLWACMCGGEGEWGAPSVGKCARAVETPCCAHEGCIGVLEELRMAYPSPSV